MFYQYLFYQVPTVVSELRNLLCLLLLDLNRFNEFHTKLESFPGNEIQNNVYIKHPITRVEFYLCSGRGGQHVEVKAGQPAGEWRVSSLVGQHVHFLPQVDVTDSSNCIVKVQVCIINPVNIYFHIYFSLFSGSMLF